MTLIPLITHFDSFTVPITPRVRQHVVVQKHSRCDVKRDDSEWKEGLKLDIVLGADRH